MKTSDSVTFIIIIFCTSLRCYTQPPAGLMLSRVTPGLHLPCSLGPHPALQIWLGKFEVIQLISLNVLISRCVMFYCLLYSSLFLWHGFTKSLPKPSPNHSNHRGINCRLGYGNHCRGVWGSLVGRGREQIPWKAQPPADKDSFPFDQVQFWLYLKKGFQCF